ncbi:hypothetical protein M404DRAFT_300763 [Pisolithus tinctorius Marx 270]|uniref:Uncharacterized protein n=1 Tax=Pisolithus tinctorius Marx 270 TaxID=870435 RepID=A0A0C3JDE8_PISTI|nr:hypothetical protein M404DRAFT_300763 [Pisolithus tinctorius Marx 270]
MARCSKVPGAICILTFDPLAWMYICMTLRSMCRFLGMRWHHSYTRGHKGCACAGWLPTVTWTTPRRHR